MKNAPKTDISFDEEMSLFPVSERIREEHAAQILSAESLKHLTLKEKKREASKPIYLVRYE